MGTDVTIDGNQLMDQVMETIGVLIPSAEPIEVVVRNFLGYTMRVCAHYAANGKLNMVSGGSMTEDIPTGSDLIYGLKSNNNGSQGIVLLDSVDTVTVSGVQMYTIAFFYYQNTFWNTLGVKGGILQMPQSVWQTIDASHYMYGLYDNCTGNPQETVFQNPAGSTILYSGEMAKFKTADQGKTEARAIFAMGDAPPFSQGGIP